MKIPVAKDGLIFIKIAVIFTLAFYIFSKLHWSFYIFSAISLFLAVFFCIFFRDPERNIFTNDKLILSPADGTVLNITKTGGKQTVEIFMSPLNVHVQRSPVSGTVKSVIYQRGSFLPAYTPKASGLNEKNIIIIQNEKLEVQVKQIAGVMVRRIVCVVKEGGQIVQGQRIGMIKFGSQVDVTMPETVEIKVKLKDKIKAGISVIGSIE